MGGSKVHRRLVAGSKVNLIHRGFKLHISPPPLLSCYTKMSTRTPLLQPWLLLLPDLALSQKGLRVSGKARQSKARQELGVRIRQTLPVLSGIMRNGSGEGVHQNQLPAQSARANSVILIMLKNSHY